MVSIQMVLELNNKFIKGAEYNINSKFILMFKFLYASNMQSVI